MSYRTRYKMEGPQMYTVDVFRADTGAYVDGARAETLQDLILWQREKYPGARPGEQRTDLARRRRGR